MPKTLESKKTGTRYFNVSSLDKIGLTNAEKQKFEIFSEILKIRKFWETIFFLVVLLREGRPILHYHQMLIEGSDVKSTNFCWWKR